MFTRLTHSRLALVVTTAVVVATVTGGIAWAVVSPVSGGVIHGCYNPATGGFQLKVTAACPTTGNKTPLNWNVQGVAGPKGATGAAGKSPIEDDTWNVTLPADSRQDVSSKTTFGPGATIQGISGKLTGDLSGCIGGFDVDVGLTANGGDVMYWHVTKGANEVNAPPSGFDPIPNTSGANQAIYASLADCINSKIKGGVPTPKLTLSITVQVNNAIPARTIT
jgi:hypothetical protein